MSLINAGGSAENGKSPLRYTLHVAAGKVGTSTSQLLKLYGPECNLIMYDKADAKHYVYKDDIDDLRAFLQKRAPGPVTIIQESNVEFLGMGQLAMRMGISPLVLTEVKRRGMWPDSISRARVGRGPLTMLYPATIMDDLRAVIEKHGLNNSKQISESQESRPQKQFNTPPGFLTFAAAAARIGMKASTLTSRWKLNMACWPKDVQVRTDVFPVCVHESIVGKMSPQLIVQTSRKVQTSLSEISRRSEIAAPLRVVTTPPPSPFSMSDIAAQLIQDGHTAMGIYLIKNHVNL